MVLLIASGKIIKRNRIGRSVSHQKIYLHIDYHGTCDEFIGQNIKVSKLQPSTSCLPIVNSQDADDVTTEIICHNTGRKNAKIDIVEAYETANPTTEAPSFVVSFVPLHEFKSSSNVQIARPLCVISDDVCAKTKVISDCEDIPVDTRKYGIVNKSSSIVYIVSNFGTKPTACFDSNNQDKCCSYVSPTNGICKEYPRSRFDYLQSEHHESDHHKKEDDKAVDIKNQIKSEPEVKKVEKVEKVEKVAPEEVSEKKKSEEEESDPEDQEKEEKQEKEDKEEKEEVIEIVKESKKSSSGRKHKLKSKKPVSFPHFKQSITHLQQTLICIMI